jgi:hypothetical protein
VAYLLFFLPLILFNSVIFGSETEKEEKEFLIDLSQDIPDNIELYFDLTETSFASKNNPKVREEVKTFSQVINFARSKRLTSIFLEARKSGTPVVISLAVLNISVFKKVINFLQNNNLNILNSDDLGYLIFYANQFDITALSEALVLHISENKFKIPYTDISQIDPIINLVKILETAINNRESNGHTNNWCRDILTWIIKDILTQAYIDSAYKQVYRKLKNKFKDKLLQDLLSQDSQMASQCKKNSLNIQSQKDKDEAEDLAHDLYNKIIHPFYLKNLLEKNPPAIYLRIKFSLAEKVEHALKALTKDEFEVIIYPDVRPFDETDPMPSDYCCCTSLDKFKEVDNCRNCEGMLSYLTAVAINWCGPQALQCLTLGWCFCACRCQSQDKNPKNLCFDNRTGREIFSCTYNCFTSMGACCRCEQYQGPTKTLKLTKKP